MSIQSRLTFRIMVIASRSTDDLSPIVRCLMTTDGR